MKKKTFLTLIIILLFIPLSALANDTGFEGGITDQQVYKEVVFLSGEPIVFSGTLKVSTTTRNDIVTSTYRYDLTSENGDKLTRNVAYETKIEKKSEYNQEILHTSIKTYSENIKIGSYSYVLDRNNGYIFSGSEVKSINPAITYYAGNYSGQKLYRVNGTKGTVKVIISDKTVGFKNKYGSTDTHQIEYSIQSQINDGTGIKSWNGEADVDVSFIDKTTLQYIENDPQYISFKGGYLLRENSSNVMTYSYSLPKMDDSGNIINFSTGNGSLRLDGAYKENRLIIPDVKDITKTWGATEIRKLMSMEIFPNNSVYFSPKVPITRLDFTIAVAKAIGIEPYTPPKTTSYSRNNRMISDISPFIDIPTTDSDYSYIKAAKDAGLISGIAPNQFGPSKFLTREQAAVIFIRALGLENLAPSGSFNTGFIDDYYIALWAKKSVYVAKEIGLISGDEYGRFNPQGSVTREESASMISRMIDFMINDLKLDYVDKILNYK
ncbi:MAG: S-layer homology domain-containing protein [Thermoanaerobacteraceae bacterium]